jgi:hypothetical protein
MAVLCETGVCHHGEAEDSNPLWCETLPLDVLFTSSQKSHVPSEHDELTPIHSVCIRSQKTWRFMEVTCFNIQTYQTVWSNTISMVRVAKFLPYRDVCRWDISDLWTESNFVYSHSLTLSFTRPITHTLIRSLMCSGITSFGPIEMWLLSTRSNNFYPKHVFNIFTYRNLKLYRYL